MSEPRYQRTITGTGTAVCLSCTRNSPVRCTWDWRALVPRWITEPGQACSRCKASLDACGVVDAKKLDAVACRA